MSAIAGPPFSCPSMLNLSRAARIKEAALKLAKIHLAWLRGEGKEELSKLSQDLLIELL